MLVVVGFRFSAIDAENGTAVLAALDIIFVQV